MGLIGGGGGGFKASRLGGFFDRDCKVIFVGSALWVFAGSLDELQALSHFWSSSQTWARKRQRRSVARSPLRETHGANATLEPRRGQKTHAARREHTSKMALSGMARNRRGGPARRKQNAFDAKKEA